MIDYSTYIKSEKAVLQRVALPGVDSRFNIFIKREDLIHHAISGNKWYKLKYNLIEAVNKGYDTILTFGGAYSNHIYAAASAGDLFGFKTIGIIRGEEHLPLNSTLTYAVSKGMEIHYISRREYREKKSKTFLDELKKKFGNVYILPEGGTNSLAVDGCAEIVHGIGIDFDYICVPCGTGGTLAGIITGLKGRNAEAVGFSALKGGGFLIEEVRNLLASRSINPGIDWRIKLDYHFGGYAKINLELISFIEGFERINGIPLDPIYTGKMMYGIRDLCANGGFKENAVIVAVHTGGLQGSEGMRRKHKESFDLKV